MAPSISTWRSACRLRSRLFWWRRSFPRTANSPVANASSPQMAAHDTFATTGPTQVSFHLVVQPLPFVTATIKCFRIGRPRPVREIRPVDAGSVLDLIDFRWWGKPLAHAGCGDLSQLFGRFPMSGDWCVGIGADDITCRGEAAWRVRLFSSGEWCHGRRQVCVETIRGR